MEKLTDKSKPTDEISRRERLIFIALALLLVLLSLALVASFLYIK